MIAPGMDIPCEHYDGAQDGRDGYELYIRVCREVSVRTGRVEPRNCEEVSWANEGPLPWGELRSLQS